MLMKWEFNSQLENKVIFLGPATILDRMGLTCMWKIDIVVDNMKRFCFLRQFFSCWPKKNNENQMCLFGIYI